MVPLFICKFLSEQSALTLFICSGASQQFIGNLELDELRGKLMRYAVFNKFNIKAGFSKFEVRRFKFSEKANSFLAISICNYCGYRMFCRKPQSADELKY